jgi:MoxR-like ATPase
MNSAMLNSDRMTYTGNLQPNDDSGHIHEPYLPDKEVTDAVNLAIYLKRPLLIKGEPGCGKTRLARAVADELHLLYEMWSVKSTSRARDGLYLYDTVGRLRDAQLAAANLLSNEEAERIKKQDYYIKWKQLGQAFRNKQRTVVLIDEIDKADIDFPNDLLLELDEQRFIVEETGEVIEAHKGAEPIVFVTSNDEKDLPDAFLRRCLFHYMKFPDKDRLQNIVLSHFPESSPEIVKKAVERFQSLRDDMQNVKGEAGKKVSTSELIDWFRVLRRYPDDEILSTLASDGKLPFASVLLKSWDDHRSFLTGRLMSASG